MAGRAESKPSRGFHSLPVTQESNSLSALALTRHRCFPSRGVGGGTFLFIVQDQLKNCFFHESLLQGTSVPT